MHIIKTLCSKLLLDYKVRTVAGYRSLRRQLLSAVLAHMPVHNMAHDSSQCYNSTQQPQSVTIDVCNSNQRIPKWSKSKNGYDLSSYCCTPFVEEINIRTKYTSRTVSPLIIQLI